MAGICLTESHDTVHCLFPCIRDIEAQYITVAVRRCELVLWGVDKVNHGPMYHRANYAILHDTAM